MKLIRMIMIVLTLETVFYVLLSVYVRSLHREALEKVWKRENPAIADDEDAMDEHVDAKMKGFRKTLRARLVTLVYVLPTAAILTIAYVVNK